MDAKIATEIAIPPLVTSGTYKIVVKVEDVVGQNHGRTVGSLRGPRPEVAPSDTLVVRNLPFLPQRRRHPARRQGGLQGRAAAMWVKFDMTGFKYGPANKIDVSYILSVILGRRQSALDTKPEAAGDQTESFYPKSVRHRRIQRADSAERQARRVRHSVEVKDAVGKQNYKSSRRSRWSDGRKSGGRGGPAVH